MAKIMCPKCKSFNIQVIGMKRKGFSIGKMVAGAALTGGVGAIAGFAGKNGKTDCFCSDCGERFKIK